ncbi:hypothetical protein BpHYR1_023653 [Brachionus plicatilis]|uniref:Uncharacterized protein n=1 Tax=Brachionus plicatilis TaxID=10195 RepID=A0A3M7STF5_BRAPC|nr:hypothetical protein BpHYR1_023653 [Brachionus plicatilis]
MQLLTIKDIRRRDIGFEIFLIGIVLTNTYHNWKKIRCSCMSCPKHYMPKHVIGIAERIALFEFQANVKSIPIGQKRRLGRTKVSANGLERQPSEAVSDSSDEDAYEDYLDIPVNQQTNIQIDNTTEIIYENEEEEKINHICWCRHNSTQTAALNNNQNDADHVHESRKKIRKIRVELYLKKIKEPFMFWKITLRRTTSSSHS